MGNKNSKLFPKEVKNWVDTIRAVNIPDVFNLEIILFAKKQNFV